MNEAPFVPPPVEEMNRSLSDWEKYLNSDPGEPPLIQCALMHYQFEAIHPFLDGNGRIGRLLITLFLCEKGFLTQPLLYLSEYFEHFRNEYYARLLSVSQRGDWRGWMDYFLDGVIQKAGDALEDSKKILALHSEYRRSLESTKKIPEASHRLIDAIFMNPVVSISGLSKKWNKPFNSVKTGVNRLIQIGILREMPGRKRNRLFIAHKLMELLTGN